MEMRHTNFQTSMEPVGMIHLAWKIDDDMCLPDMPGTTFENH